MKKQHLSGFLFEEEDELAKITLFQDEKNEYIDLSFMDDLSTILVYVNDSSQIKALLIDVTSKNSWNFNYPLLLKEKNNAIYFFSKWEKLIVELEKISKLTVIKLAGDIQESKFHLAMVCDIKVATKDVTFNISSVKYGLIPGMLIFKLAKYMGLGNAKSFILGNKSIDADTALLYSLINKIVDSHDDGPLFLRWLYDIVPKQNIHMVSIIRRLLNESFHDTFEDAIGHYLAAQDRCVHLVK